MSVSEVSYLPSSIQGEQTAPARIEHASEADVDRYVNEHSDGVVQCRMERRHVFETPRNGMVFTDVNREGNFVAEYTCKRCDSAYRRETWYPARRGKGVRYELLDVTVRYKQNAAGENYLMPPGAGRALPRNFRESVMSSVMAGQSPAAMRKAIARSKAGNAS